MSQEQPQRPIKYGDVFYVKGDLASQPIAPQDAVTLQAAETQVLGQNPKGGPAAVMQSAANINERRGVVGHDDMTEAVKARGATIAQAQVAGYQVITEAVGGQVIGQYGMPVDTDLQMGDQQQQSGDQYKDPVTIGEALETSAISAGNKPIDQSDVAAIQAAEVRATRRGHILPGGVAAEAQSAAARNLQVARDEDKTRLADVLTDTADKLTSDRPVTREDAAFVISAELRNNPDLATYPGGVAASMAAAATLNQEK